MNSISFILNKHHLEILNLFDFNYYFFLRVRRIAWAPSSSSLAQSTILCTRRTEKNEREKKLGGAPAPVRRCSADYFTGTRNFRESDTQRGTDQSGEHSRVITRLKSATLPAYTPADFLPFISSMRLLIAPRLIARGIALGRLDKPNSLSRIGSEGCIAQIRVIYRSKQLSASPKLSTDDSYYFPS